MTDKCEFNHLDYCVPPEEFIKAGWKCPQALPIQPGDITNKCGARPEDLLTEEEYDEKYGVSQ